MDARATAAIATPIGLVMLTASEAALLSVRILPGRTDTSDGQDHPILAPALRQMSEWFMGERVDFDIPLVELASDEGRALRAGIVSVPYGHTQTYGEVAARTGSIARAVGQACKTNPYPIIIPCHRVTSASGPEYYSGGAGPRTKTWLIDFEHDHLPPHERNRLL
jgi:methylated-DNA-[protein]-cysteine S-methyltransferase